MDASTRLQRGSQATFQVVAEEAVLIHMHSGTYYSLNRVGTEFWNMLDGQQSIQQLAATLAQKYNVDEAMVAADLLELAEKLKAEDLVDIA